MVVMIAGSKLKPRDGLIVVFLKRAILGQYIALYR